MGHDHDVVALWQRRVDLSPPEYDVATSHFLEPPFPCAFEGGFGATGVLESRILEQRGKRGLDSSAKSFVELSCLGRNAEVVEGGPDSPLSHCLSLHWFRSYIVVRGMGPQLGQAAVVCAFFWCSVVALSRSSGEVRGRSQAGEQRECLTIVRAVVARLEVDSVEVVFPVWRTVAGKSRCGALGCLHRIWVLGYNQLVDHVGTHGQRSHTEALNKDSLVRQKEYPTESSSKSRESVYRNKCPTF
ncbi:hypothetical protein Taro_053681 [Colocasia esculenta]|uniref:Uncharacterized protein n=1 Tax=Colocasia esculenta TaxID=4460 RepID=A0A843XNY8_COLES|nr:hypothetical protein [Colocasia esculenta]